MLVGHEPALSSLLALVGRDGPYRRRIEQKLPTGRARDARERRAVGGARARVDADRRARAAARALRRRCGGVPSRATASRQAAGPSAPRRRARRRARSDPCAAPRARSRTTRRVRSRARSTGRRAAPASSRRALRPTRPTARAGLARSRAAGGRRRSSARGRRRACSPDACPARATAGRRSRRRPRRRTRPHRDAAALPGGTAARPRRYASLRWSAASRSPRCRSRSRAGRAPARRSASAGRIRITGRRPRDRHGADPPRRRAARPARSSTAETPPKKRLRPAHRVTVSPGVLERPLRLVRPAALEVDDPVLDVEPRPADRILDPEPAARRPRRRLHDRPREPHRAGAAEHEPRAAAVEHERRRHHARQPLAGRPLARWPITSSSPSMLLSWKPPRNTPEPDPSVDDSAAALPSASITETWVVPVSLAPGLRRRSRPRARGRGRPPQRRRPGLPRAEAVELGERAGDRRGRPWTAAGTSRRACRRTRLRRPSLDHLVRGDVVRELGTSSATAAAPPSRSRSSPGTISCVATRSCAP